MQFQIICNTNQAHRARFPITESQRAILLPQCQLVHRVSKSPNLRTPATVALPGYRRHPFAVLRHDDLNLQAVR
jgi:hypothetical protein